MARKYNGSKANKATQGALDLQTVKTAQYLRVSTDKQADEGYGLAAQRSELDAYCEAQGWHVEPDHVYIDAGLSGKTDERPAFQAMMAAAQAGQIGRIVTLKLDRIARNLKNLLQTVDTLKGFGCTLIVKKEAFDTGTPQGLFVFQMLGAVAELERSMIGERVQSGRVAKASEGGYLGSRCPLGYRYLNGEFLITERAQVVKEIFSMGLQGMGLRAIARHLETTDTQTPSGKGSWTPAGVKHILSNGCYAGLAQWDGTETETGNYPIIVDRSTYDAMQVRLSSMKQGERADLVSSS